MVKLMKNWVIITTVSGNIIKKKYRRFLNIFFSKAKEKFVLTLKFLKAKIFTLGVIRPNFQFIQYNFSAAALKLSPNFDTSQTL